MRELPPARPIKVPPKADCKECKNFVVIYEQGICKNCYLKKYPQQQQGFEKSKNTERSVEYVCGTCNK